MQSNFIHEISFKMEDQMVSAFLVKMIITKQESDSSGQYWPQQQQWCNRSEVQSKYHRHTHTHTLDSNMANGEGG